jgi:hypothetical protein
MGKNYDCVAISKVVLSYKNRDFENIFVKFG